MGVAGGLVALDCRTKGPGFQSHLQRRFISLLGALSPTSRKFEYKVFFGGDVKPLVPGTSLITIGDFLILGEPKQQNQTKM